ncbi:hypothetical protein [Sphingomonas colocasiae]|nr:hypothetical protein [Sphingomonas colocasiae]
MTQDARPRPGDAGHDQSISERLEKDPKDKDAKLDEALDESMDASDPPAITPKGGKDPVPSSGYDPEAEKAHEAG